MGKNKKLVWDIFYIVVGMCSIVYVVLTSKSISSLDVDKVSLTYPIYVDMSKAIHSDSFSLWNPHLWGGFPNIGHMATQQFYPINWILCNLFYNSDTAMVSYAIIPTSLIIHYAIFYLGIYFLVKKLGFSQLNAFATGMTSTLSGALFYYSSWLAYTDSFCWLPLIILFSIKMYEANDRKKLLNAIILGILFAVLACVSISFMLIMAVCLFGLIYITFIFGNSRATILKNTLYSVLTGVLGVLLSSPVILNVMTYMKYMVRFVPDQGFISGSTKVPIEEYSKYKFVFSDFLQMINFSSAKLGISISAFTLLFCIIGMFCRKKNKTRLYYISFFGVIICGLACFAIVFPTAFCFIPGLNSLREAFMYGILLNLFASIIAAHGFHVVEQIILEKLKLKEELYLVVLAGLVILVLLGYNILSRNVTCILFAILVILYAFIFVLKRENIKKVLFYLYTFMFVGLCGIDLYNNALAKYAFTELETIKQVEVICENSQMLVDYIKKLDSTDNYYRMTDWGYVESYPANMASITGFYDVKGYWNPTLASGINIHLTLPLEKRAQLQNIKYYLVSARDNKIILDMFENNNNYIKVGEIDNIYFNYFSLDKGTVYIFEAKNNLGDAWVVSDFMWNETYSQEEVLNMIANNDFSMGTTAIVNRCVLTDIEEKNISAINVDKDTGIATCRSISNNTLIYDVSTETSGILVTTELYYPGWKAYVNGEKATILEVNGTNRGVVVPVGTSTVEFKFRPMELIVGIVLQMLTVVILIILSIVNNVHYRKIETINSRKEKCL